MQRSVDIPIVSVVMTAYNADRYIEKSIKSILSQSFKDFEFIIIDDGSTDNTANIISYYASKDARIRPIIEGKKGYYNARRLLVEMARGKYIAVLDADDIAMPYRLELQFDFMEANENYGFCGGDCICIDAEDKRHTTKFAHYPHDNDNIKASLLFYNCNIHPCAFVRSKVLRENNITYKDCAAEDWQLWLQLSSVTMMHNVEKPIIYYRIHDGNMNKSPEIVQRYKNEINAMLWQHISAIYALDKNCNNNELFQGYMNLVYWENEYENYDYLKLFIVTILESNKQKKYVQQDILASELFRRVQKKFIRYNKPEPLHYKHYRDIVAILKNHGNIVNDYLRDGIILFTAKTQKRWLK